MLTLRWKSFHILLYAYLNNDSIPDLIQATAVYKIAELLGCGADDKAVISFIEDLKDSVEGELAGSLLVRINAIKGLGRMVDMKHSSLSLELQQKAFSVIAAAVGNPSLPREIRKECLDQLLVMQKFFFDTAVRAPIKEEARHIVQNLRDTHSDLLSISQTPSSVNG